MFLHPFPGDFIQTPITRTGALGVVQAADANQNVTKNKTKSSEYAILGEALAWPAYMGERGTVAPLGTAALMSFLAVPLFFPAVTLGGSVLLGYGSGSLIYLAEFHGKPPVSQKKGNNP